MNLTKLLFPLLFLFVGSITSVGQVKIISGTTLQTPKEYYLQVKQFSEFIERFNYKTDWKGNRITEEFSKKVPRNAYLLYLVNGADPRLIDPVDSSYRVICSEFIAFIDNPKKPQEINLYSGQVKAVAQVNIIYEGNAHKVKIELTPDVLPDRSARWVISGVESTIFAANPDSLAQHFIAPNSHETSFINLKKIEGSSDGVYFLATPIANTVKFIDGIKRKKIQIQNIEKVTYHIVFTGWQITVEEFNRVSNNSGWLISDIKRLDY